MNANSVPRSRRAGFNPPHRAVQANDTGRINSALQTLAIRRTGFNPPLLIRNIAGLCLAVALAGCLQPQQRAEEFSAASWPARREALQSLDHWSLQSRIALSTDEEGWSGTLSWRQDENYVEARFSGPLGVGGFRIEGVPERLEIETSEGEHFVFTDPEAELATELGWRVPLASMRYWMLGVADPLSGDAEETLNEHGRLAELEQRDWTVRYTSYRSFDGDTLPRKLVMENDDLRIRLAVDDWELGGPRL